MSCPSTDRNLLIALLAFQNNFINRQDLLTAFDAWTGDKSRSIAALLFDQQKLSAAQRDLIEALAAEHLKQHQNDPQRSLAALSAVADGWGALSKSADQDLQQTLEFVRRVGVDSTLPFAADDSTGLARSASTAVGASTSGGQRFRILRPHAKGGLGQVSVARDQELKREVALKEIRTEYADEPIARSRFTLEAEITGGLEHPGIVPVYGLGAYADGRPFYAMRFIRGDSLKDAIAAFFDKHSSPTTNRRASGREPDVTEVKLPAAAFQSLDFRQLLGRFVAVCNAVAYAHARGVLHRDLKPANVMLGNFGETLVVDWGLAKATGKGDVSLETSQPPLASAADSGSETRMGSTIGTVGYMSPEQAAGQVDQFGPATDIYLLGATLYHILTGHAPHRGKDQDQVLTQILAGKFHGTREVNSAIPAPLAAICHKAMSFESNDRYGTAAELAQDVDRFLADERVTSYVEPASVRTRRWLRKHPKSVATLAATLLVGLASSVVIAGVVSNNAQVVAGKNSQLARQNEDLIKSNKAEKDAKEDAQAVIDFFQNNVLARARPENQEGGLGITATIRAAIDASEPDIAAAFQDRPLVEASLRHSLGSTYLYLGEPLLAIAQHKVACKLRESQLGPAHFETLASMNNLASAYLDANKLEEALPLLEETVELMKAYHGAEHPGTLISMNDLASAYESAGKLDLAIPLFEQTLELMKSNLGPNHPHTLNAMNNLADAQMSAGILHKALPLLEQTLELRKAKLGAIHPDTLTSMNSLAIAYESAGKLEQALPLYEQTLESRKAKLGLEHADTLTSMNDLANAHKSAGNLDQALQLYEQTVELRKTKLGLEHAETLISMNNLANAHKSAGNLEQAMPLYLQTLELMKANLGPDHPHTLNLMNNLASAYDSAGELEQALLLYLQTVELKKANLGPEHPDTLGSMGNLAHVYLRSKQFDKAKPMFEAFVAGQRRRMTSNELGLGSILVGISRDLVKHEQFREAEVHLRECLAICERKVPDAWPVFDTKSVLGAALTGQKKLEEAEPLLLAGYEGLKQRQDTVPAASKTNITEALKRLVALYTAWDKPAEAAKWQAVLDAAEAAKPAKEQP